MKTFRVKKDVDLYHPTPIILLKGSKLKAENLMSIIFSINRLINVHLEVAKEYFEEVESDPEGVIG